MADFQFEILSIDQPESRREFRRLQLLREWSYEADEALFLGSEPQKLDSALSGKLLAIAARHEGAMRRKRRNHSSAFRAKVALAAVKEDRTLSELAQQFDVHPNQTTQWKRQLVEDAGHTFVTGQTAALFLRG